MSNPTVSQSAPLQIGSSVVPLYVNRQMKLYLVTENEFESLSSLNGQSTVFSSVGSALISLALSIWVNAVFYTDVPPAAAVAKSLGAPVLLAIALVFFYLSYKANKARGNTWSTIKNESNARASGEGVSTAS
jgi:hypothetical protein